MSYIKRDLEHKFMETSKEYACLLITGPRQVGKTTMLRNLMEKERNYVTLDDLEERKLATTEPALFLQMHKPPVLIDEVQYAPQLFSYIKMEVDSGAVPGSFWLTGSQAFSLMQLAQESLAGRTAIFSLPPLSQHELHGIGDSEPFQVNFDALDRRKTAMKPADLAETYERIWNGALPGHVSKKYTDWDLFYASFVSTYIDRDVKEMIDGVDSMTFHDFIRSAACRVGQQLNVTDIAKDVGVSPDTAKRWLSVLEKSQIIFFLRPYSNNLLKRTIKTPKMYFFDTGLVAFLTKYSTSEILAGGAINGHILENYVVSEIRKTYQNAGKEPLLWYYRDKDSREVDLVMESDGNLHPLEIKRSANPGSELVSAFKVLDKGSVPRSQGAIICLRKEFTVLDRENFIVPVWMI